MNSPQRGLRGQTFIGSRVTQREPSDLGVMLFSLEGGMGDRGPRPLGKLVAELGSALSSVAQRLHSRPPPRPPPPGLQ